MGQVTLTNQQAQKAVLALREIKNTKVQRDAKGRPNFVPSLRAGTLMKQLMPYVLEYEQKRMEIQDEYTAREIVADEDGKEVKRPVKVIDIGTGMEKTNEIRYTDATKYHRDTVALSNTKLDPITVVDFTAADLFSLLDPDNVAIEQVADLIPVVVGGEQAIMDYMAAQEPPEPTEA